MQTFQTSQLKVTRERGCKAKLIQEFCNVYSLRCISSAVGQQYRLLVVRGNGDMVIFSASSCQSSLI